MIFFGTLAGDLQTAFFNILYVALLGLIVGLSMSWSFTEEWGEYFALMFWATVGMMLLTAAEELVTLFLTLETMTICLYLSTAHGEDQAPVGGGGPQVFRLRIGLVGALPVRAQPDLRHDGDDVVRWDSEDPGTTRARPVWRTTSPAPRRSCSCWWASGSRSRRSRSINGRPMLMKERRRP